MSISKDQGKSRKESGTLVNPPFLSCESFPSCHYPVKNLHDQGFSLPLSPLRLNPELPIDLELVIRKALEKDRKIRYQTASDLRAELEAAETRQQFGTSRYGQRATFC